MHLRKPQSPKTVIGHLQSSIYSPSFINDNLMSCTNDISAPTQSLEMSFDHPSISIDTNASSSSVIRPPKTYLSKSKPKASKPRSIQKSKHNKKVVKLYEKRPKTASLNDKTRKEYEDMIKSLEKEKLILKKRYRVLASSVTNRYRSKLKITHNINNIVISPTFKLKSARYCGRPSKVNLHSAMQQIDEFRKDFDLIKFELIDEWMVFENQMKKMQNKLQKLDKIKQNKTMTQMIKNQRQISEKLCDKSLRHSNVHYAKISDINKLVLTIEKNKDVMDARIATLCGKMEQMMEKQQREWTKQRHSLTLPSFAKRNVLKNVKFSLLAQRRKCKNLRKEICEIHKDFMRWKTECGEEFGKSMFAIHFVVKQAKNEVKETFFGKLEGIKQEMYVLKDDHTDLVTIYNESVFQIEAGFEDLMGIMTKNANMRRVHNNDQRAHLNEIGKALYSKQNDIICMRENVYIMKNEYKMFENEWRCTLNHTQRLIAKLCAQKRKQKNGNERNLKNLKGRIMSVNKRCADIRASYGKTKMFMDKFAMIHRVEIAHIKNIIINMMKRENKKKQQRKRLIKKLNKSLIMSGSSVTQKSLIYAKHHRMEHEQISGGGHKMYLKLLKEKKDGSGAKKRRALLKVQIADMETVLKNMYHSR